VWLKLVEHLSSKQEAISLNPKTGGEKQLLKKKKKKKSFYLQFGAAAIIFMFFLRQGLSKTARLASNSRASCQFK
jgi:hypothetical protein